MNRRRNRVTLSGAAIWLLLAMGAANAAQDGRTQVVTVPTWVQADSGAYLGVRLTEETEHVEGGALVSHVVEGSPADRAGIERGDIVVGFGDEPIRGPLSLTKRIHGRSAGETVTVRVLREGREREIEVELGRRASGFTVRAPNAFEGQHWQEWSKALEDRTRAFNQQLGQLPKFTAPELYGKVLSLVSPWGGKATLGVQLVETTTELRDHLGGSEDEGVLVSKVLENSAARRAGIEVGDLILSVDGASVASVDALRRELRDKAGERFEIRVVRKGQLRSIDVEIDEPEEDRPTGPRAAASPTAPRPLI